MSDKAIKQQLKQMIINFNYLLAIIDKFGFHFDIIDTWQKKAEGIIPKIKDLERQLKEREKEIELLIKVVSDEQRWRLEKDAEIQRLRNGLDRIVNGKTASGMFYIGELRDIAQQALKGEGND